MCVYFFFPIIEVLLIEPSTSKHARLGRHGRGQDKPLQTKNPTIAIKHLKAKQRLDTPGSCVCILFLSAAF